MQNKQTKHSSKKHHKKISRNRSRSPSSKIQKYQNKNLQFQQVQNEQNIQDFMEEEIMDVKVDQNSQQYVGIDLDAKISEIVEKIHLNIISTDIVQLEQNTKLMPVVLQIEVLKQQIKHARANIDLICVVDVSGSMIGQSIDLVKDSLRYVLKILNESDRISIVSFSSNASIELSWTINSLQNKEKIKKAIQGMKIRDTTNIASGVNLGLQLIKKRKLRNPVTCMIVLSDGQDNQEGASDRIAQCLKEYNIQDDFIINTFGYGSDHDPIEMNNISNLKNGQFTFIENIKEVSEHFILSMGGLLSVFAKNTILSIEENPQFKIQKLFGDDDLWQNKQQGVYEMNINYLLENESKEFALMIEIPSKQDFNQQVMEILKATLKGNLIQFNSDFEKQSSLSVQFTTEQIQEELKEIVEVNYLRQKSGDIIKKAQELAQLAKYEQAKQLLDEMIEEIQKSKFNQVNIMVSVLTDLNQIKEVCQPTVFRKKGQAVMINKRKRISRKQKALSNSSEWNSDEEEQLDKFKRGDLMLSCSDKDDNNSFSNSRRRRKFKKQRRQSSSSSSDYENSDSENRKSKQKYSSSSSRNSSPLIKKKQRLRQNSSDS